MQKMMVIGAVGSGKTTLCQKLHGHELIYKKTQAVEYFKQAIDTPGEFAQQRMFYSRLMVTAADVEVIVLVQSVIQTEQIFPPLVTSMFNKPVIGIVTKIDLAQSEQEIALVRKQLELAGVEKIFQLSAVTGQGIEEFEQELEKEVLNE